MTDRRFSDRPNSSPALSGGFGEADSDALREGVPLGGTRAEATQRLQIGLFGLGSMVLLIGLASIIGNQANLTRENAVPQAAPTTEPIAPPPQRDPLADAGIVPDIAVEAPPAPVEEPAILPDLPAEGSDQAPPEPLDAP